MAFCRNCGANIPDMSTFCSHCGTPVQAEQAPQQNYQEPINNNNAQVAFNPADVQENKVMGILAYIWLLVLVPIFAAKDSEYARFHAKQGTKLCILSIAYSLASWIVKLIVYAIFRPTYYFFVPVINPVASIVATVLNIASVLFLVLAIIGIVNACKGERKELPFINKIKFLDDIVSKFIK